jgi:hypothetical protein
VLLIGLTAYLVANSIHVGELTFAVVRRNIGLTCVLVVLVGAVGVFALRLLVPKARRSDRLISRQGIAGFGVVMAGLALVSWRLTGHVPWQAIPMLLGLIVALRVPAPNKPAAPPSDSPPAI